LAPALYIPVVHYWYASGILISLKARIAPESVRRPLGATLIDGQPLTGMALSPPETAAECVTEAVVDSKVGQVV